MIDIQKLFDALSESSRVARGQYQMTLGPLIEALSAADPSLPVALDTGEAPGRAHSYRGYYSDLSFSPGGESVTAGDFLESCRAANGKVFEGYKGGDFKMADDTPVWAAPYGCCGRAIMDVTVSDDGVVLVTKDVDA